MPHHVATPKYFTKTKQAVESGLFDVIAHFDLIRGYLPQGHGTLTQASELIDAAFELMVKRNVYLEINSRRKTDAEPYPSQELILRYMAKGGRLFSFGSDAHSTLNWGSG